MSDLPERYSNPAFREFVSVRIAAMYSGLKTFGKTYDGSALTAWMIVLMAQKITASEVTAGVEHFLKLSGEVPMPGEFAAWCIQNREDAEIKERVRLTVLELKAESQWYRDALIAQGLDPDQMVPISSIALEIANLVPRTAISGGDRRALPDTSDWSDTEQETRIKEQIKQQREADDDGA